MQVVVKHMPIVKSIVTACLVIDNAHASAETLDKAMRTLLCPSSKPILFLPDFYGIVEGGCMLNDHGLGFVFITADVVTLDLPKR